MNTQWTIFLDLEETLIESWSDHTLLVNKIVKINRFVNKTLVETKQPLSVPRFGLMSWAVYNDKDKRQFQEELQPWLEEQMQITFSNELILSIDDWISLVMNNCGILLSREDIFDLSDKETILFWLRNAKKGFPTGHIILIDDVVKHNNVIISDSRKITILNVDKL